MTAFNARNVVLSFVTQDGPVREARFVRKPDGAPDGGVHNLFVVSGRNDGTADASGCALTQPDFALQQALGNVILRIPTPVFGAGLIEQIPDSAITANQAANALTKRAYGISGRPNLNGNDGRISRFGWKAQNQSLLLFAGEAYNVEVGITNKLFQQERAYGPGCQFAAQPNDTTDTGAATPVDAASHVEQFAFFLHDGRTSDLLEAIRLHSSIGNRVYGPSEANVVTDVFSTSSEADKQDLLNFLRSL